MKPVIVLHVLDKTPANGCLSVCTYVCILLFENYVCIVCVPQLAAVPRVIFLVHSICSSPVWVCLSCSITVQHNSTFLSFFLFRKTTAHIPICICIQWRTMTLTAVVTAGPDYRCPPGPAQARARPDPAFTVPCLVRPYISTGR